MIDRALVFLRDELKSHLSGRLTAGAAESLVLTSVLDSDGRLAIPSDSIGMTVVHLEEERILRDQGPMYRRDESGSLRKENPEVRLMLDLLFCANYRSYSEAWRSLSLVLSFFQSRNVFEPSTYPALDAGIEKLVVEHRSLSFEEQNHLWSVLGANLLPFALYRTGVVPVREEQVLGLVRPVETIVVDAGDMGSTS
ncbi:MAG: DUF4255 domain-containing protein [Planctomycetes bacterium]|nr:DUF4255 domain-containing protein [Planctomycetota bacterium]